MSNQALTRTSHVSSVTFTNKPSEETRKALVAAGFQFDPKSRQWYSRQEAADVKTEEMIAAQLAA